MYKRQVFQSLTGSSNSTALKEYLEGNNLFTLRYANWPKDLFMGVMPNSQLGDVSVVDVVTDSTTRSYPVSLFSSASGPDGTNKLGAAIPGAPFNQATDRPSAFLSYKRCV